MKRAAVFLADGFETIEGICPLDLLRRAGIGAVSVSISENRTVKSAQAVYVNADYLFDEVKGKLIEYEAVYIPGGLKGADSMRDYEPLTRFLKEYSDNGGIVAAICAGPQVLEKAGIISGKRVTIYPGLQDRVKSAKYEDSVLVDDGNVITAQGPAMSMLLSYELIAKISGRDKADEVLKGTLYEKLFE